MKRPLLFLLLLLISVVAFAQKIHFCDSTNEWHMIWSSWNAQFPHNYISAYKAGPTINGIKYEEFVFGQTLLLVREDTIAGKVYWMTDSTEEILYDYNWKVGDTVHYSYDTVKAKFFYVVDSIGSTNINGLNYKVWEMHNLQTTTATAPSVYYVIEGIGSTLGPVRVLFPDAFEISHMLICFSNNNLNSSLHPAVDYFDNATSCTLSVQDVSALQTASVYPNPITSSSCIKLPYIMKNGIVQIVNAVGQVVWQRTVSNEKEIWIGDKITVDGVYYYKITGDDGKLLQGKLNKE